MWALRRSYLNWVSVDHYWLTSILSFINALCSFSWSWHSFFVLGNGIAALQSVPTAIFCVLHCLEPQDGLPERFGGLERTIAYSLALGGDTDTIACMAGAIAGAHYGIDSIPQSWQESCEGVEEADDLARRLYDLYCLPQFEEDRGTSSCGNNQPRTHANDQHTAKTDWPTTWPYATCSHT